MRQGSRGARRVTASTGLNPCVPATAYATGAGTGARAGTRAGVPIATPRFSPHP